MSEARDTLLDTIDTVRKSTEGDSTSFGDIVESLENRGYGPLVMALSAFVILPTGIIPGVPAVVGLALVLVAAQMIAGRSHPWMPGWMRNFDLPDDKLRDAADRARPWAERLSTLLDRRFEALVAPRIAAACLILAGLIMVPLGFVPLLPLALGCAALLLGLALTVKDGAVAALGYLVFAVGLWLAWRGVA